MHNFTGDNEVRLQTHHPHEVRSTLHQDSRFIWQTKHANMASIIGHIDRDIYCCCPKYNILTHRVNHAI